MEELKENHSLELSDLVSKLLNTDPQKRPTADELMNHPFLVRQLQRACKTKESEIHSLFPHDQVCERVVCKNDLANNGTWWSLCKTDVPYKSEHQIACMEEQPAN